MVEHTKHSQNEGSFKDHVKDEEWACPQCTLLNPLTSNVCNACMLEKPPIASEAAPPLLEDEPEIIVGRDHEGRGEKKHQEEESKLVLFVEAPPIGDENQEDGGLRQPLLGDAASPSDFANGNNTSPPEVVCFDPVEDPITKKRRRRRRRRFRMVVGGVGGLIVGAVVFCGPIGVVFGTVAGAVGARQISKRRERKKDERTARTNAVTLKDDRDGDEALPRQLSESKTDDETQVSGKPDLSEAVFA